MDKRRIVCTYWRQSPPKERDLEILTRLQANRLLTLTKVIPVRASSDQIPIDQTFNATVVVDGTCVTSRGPGTAIEFALELIEVLFEKEAAEKVAEPMLVLQK